MSSTSPPKPWERGTRATTPIFNPQRANPAPAPASAVAIQTSSSQPPALPPRPTLSNTHLNPPATRYPYSPTQPYGTPQPYRTAQAFGTASRINSAPYGGIGGYTSPYTRYGGMNNPMYGGGYGSMFGGIGGMPMFGGMGGPGMMGADPNDPNSLTNSFNQNTQATFQMIEGIVGAFGGLAQMLESTYMATHSSFFAMISVAEQFTNLRNTLGSILGIFTILRWLRTLFAKMTGRPPPVDATSLTPSAFASFRGLSSHSTSSSPPAPSRKPFIVFLLAAFGLPYLVSKLIKSLTSPHFFMEPPLLDPGGTPLPHHEPAQPYPVEAHKLEFCRVLFDYNPPPRTAKKDLAVKKGDIVAVLMNRDVMGNPIDWWRCRTRDGRTGYLPNVYLEAIQRKIKKEGTSGSEGTIMTEGSIKDAVIEPSQLKGKLLQSITKEEEKAVSR